MKSRIWLCIIFVMMIISNNISSTANGAIDLPEKIYTKTPTQTFTVDHYFAIFEGKIYYKRNQEVINSEMIYEKIKDQNPVDFNEWRLLEPNGIIGSGCIDGVPGLPNPQSKKTKDFKIPSRIIEISADNSMLIALSDDSHFYYCYLNDGSKFYKIRGWTDRWGSPKKELYYSEKFMSWQVGRRSEKIEWFEDPSGYKRSYSGFGLSTLYALTKEGRDIYFVDNGMPQSFHDIIATPENGEFIAESMSVSGDTIFLIDKYGNMFTRLADFDSIGDDVMLYKYTYKELPLPENNDGKSFEATQFGKEFTKIAVKLPCEPWRKQESILLKGKASVTNKITILTTGKGNAGRELRAVGTDENGSSGYYFKNIFDEKWNFKIIEAKIGDEDIIKVDVAKLDLGKSERKNYNGIIHFSNFLEVDADLENFTSKYAPSTIDPAIIKMTIDDEIIEMKLHMVNTWKPVFNPEEYPYNESRTFFGTLEMSEGINTKNGKFNKIMKRLYKRYNLKEFRFIVEAGENYVRIHQKNGSKMRFVMNFVREGVKLTDIKKRAFLDTFIKDDDKFVRIANSEELIIKDTDNIDINDVDKIVELKDKLNLNIQKYVEIKELRREARSNVSKTMFKAFSFRIIQGFFLLTGTITVPESMHFFKYMGMLFAVPAIQQNYLLNHTNYDYLKSVEIFEKRIYDYSAKLKKLDGKMEPTEK